MKTLCIKILTGGGTESVVLRILAQISFGISAILESFVRSSLERSMSGSCSGCKSGHGKKWVRVQDIVLHQSFIGLKLILSSFTKFDIGGGQQKMALCLLHDEL